MWITLRHDNVLVFYGICYGLYPTEESLGVLSPWMSNGKMPDYVKLHPDASKVKLVSTCDHGEIIRQTKSILDFRGCCRFGVSSQS